MMDAFAKLHARRAYMARVELAIKLAFLAAAVAVGIGIGAGFAPNVCGKVF